MSAGLQFLFCFIPPVNWAYLGYLQHKLNKAVTAGLPEPEPAAA
jgi:hypothetical protein